MGLWTETTMADDWQFGARSTADQVLAGRDLRGRTIIVTGANTGIGYTTALALAGAGASVIFACRNAGTGEAAAARARAGHPGCSATYAALDLASFTSILAFAAGLSARPIDALVCNAGLMSLSFGTTEEGFERTLGVCHIGHFLLARLLLPRLLAAGAPRVVMVSSESHRSPKSLDLARLPMQRDTFRGMAAYGQAKLCNVLMAKSLQRRYGDRGLAACSLHPGTLVTTDIGRNSVLAGLLMKLISPFTKTPEQGAATSVLAVVREPASDLAGIYLNNCRPAPASDLANDPVVAQRLWDASERWLLQIKDLQPWP